MVEKDNHMRIVEATPMEHGADYTRFDIPRWGVTFPITVYRMNPEQQHMLPLNQTRVMLMLARSLKHGKSADLQENWNWQFVRLASDEEKEEYYVKNPPVKRADVRMTGPAGMSPNEVYRHLSIQRQTALKLAMKHVHAVSKDPTEDQILATAGRFADWIEEGILNQAGQGDQQLDKAQPLYEEPIAVPESEDETVANSQEPAETRSEEDILVIPEDDDTPAGFMENLPAAEPEENEARPQAEPASANGAAALPSGPEAPEPQEYHGDPSEMEWTQN